MKRLLFFLMAIIFAITGKAQTPLVENFSSSTFPPTGWTRLTGLASTAFTGTAPTTTTAGWTRVITGYGITNAHPKLNVFGTTCKYWIVTPTVDLGTGGNYTLTFDLAHTAYGSAAVASGTRDDDKFMVIISTDNGATWQQTNTTIWDNVGSTRVFNNIPNVAQNVSIDLSSYSGQIKIAFYGESTATNGDNDIHIGNVVVTTCPAPNGLLANNITTSSADLTWNLTNATDYTLEYKMSSQSDWSLATSIPNLSTNTYPLQGLNHSTSYDFRVKANCVVGVDESVWNTSSFNTSCATITQFPWIEGFENAFNPVNIAPGNKPAPYCWFIIDSINTSSYFWKTSSSAYNGSKSIYFEGYGSATTTTSTYNNNDWLISPVITLTGNERLNFWSKKSSSSYKPDLLIYAMDVSQGDLNPTASNANFIYLGEVDTNLLSTTYAPYEFNLSTLVGDYRFAFVRKKNANGSVYLDDVKVSAIPTCFPPTEVAISNISTDQADLNFTPADISGPSWQVMLKNMTTNVIETDQINSLPHTFYNLTPNTNYSVSIITDCGDGTFSDPTLPLIFRTQCVPATIPYLEDFSTSVVVEPTCWTRMSGLLADTSVLTSTTSGWTRTTNMDTSMYVNIYGIGVKYWLISPTIDLGMDGSLYQLDFDVVYSDLTSGLGDPTHTPDDIFAVVVSTDNGDTWRKANATIWYASPDSLNTLTAFSPTSTHVSLKLQDADMNPYSGNIKIGLYGESTVALTGADNYLFVDNFAVDLAPMCPAVFNTTTSVDNFSTIRVNFATDNAEPGTGWDIAYAETDPTSFDPNAATIVSVNDATELPYIITGLNAGSTYSLSVRQNCGGEWSPAVSSSIPNIESTVAVPYIQNFEDLNNVSEWTLSNPDTNKWYISNAVSYPDNSGNSLFISDSLGATNEYTNNVISYAYASTIVDFGTGAAEYNLSFDWRARGESSSYDYIKVFLLPIDQAIPTTGWPVGQALGTFNQQSTWQHANIILPASEYENTVKKLVFIWWNDGSTGTNPPAAVDNIQIVPMTCATPSNLVVSLVDQTSATISWTENGTSTSWLIEYSFNGINWTSELASTNTDFVLSNLNPSSTYQVRVYSLCSSIDTSSFVSNVFQTDCGVISQFPWNEGFDEAFVGTSASNSLSAAPRCWSNFNGGYTSTTYQWKRGTTASNIYAGAGYAYMDGYYSTSSATYTNNDWLITPVLQLTGNERLNFWIKKEGETYFPDLAIYVLDMNNGDVNATDSISNFTLLANIPNNTISTTYQHQEVDLSSLNGQYRLAFVRLQPSQYDLYIDEVKVSSLPNCRRVSDVALSNVSHEEATITWTPGQTTDAAWNIYLTQGSSTVTIPATQIPTTITNLLPNTDYSFVVKTDCGTEESDPTIPISFTTSCTPLAVPYLEEFATSPLTNDCWEVHNGLLADTVAFTSNSSSWTYNNSYPAASPITSMRLNIWNTTTNSWLVTPTIDLGNTSTLYQLEFDVTNSNLAMLVPGVLTGVDDKFAVVISTDNGLTWTSANAHIWSNETGATRVYNDLMSTTPIHIIIPLQDENLIPYQGLIKVGFYGESTVSNADNYLNIDNVAINEWADCQRPTGLAVNGVSFDQATISFTEQGTATSWEYSLGEVVTGVDNDPNAGTIVSIFDNPHTIQGLTPSTDYYIAVRSDCMSPWSDIVTFRTTALNVTTFPYTATFDEFDPESYNWTSLSNSVNRWVVGNATSSNLGTSTDLSSAYISFNDGDSNSATTATTRAYFYRDFDFGTTPTTYDLSFDWKCLGTYNSSTNTVNSGIMVIPCETTDSINLGGLPLNQNQRVLMVHSQTDWQNATAQLDNMSGIKRLIFYTWGYSSSNRYNPAAIDNITIEQSTCARPNGLVAANLTTNSADITWNGSADSYILTYRASNDTTDTYMSQIGTAASLSNLLPGTSYYVWVKSICGTDTTINSVSLSFRTPCYDNAITTFPYNEGFENGLNCWDVTASGTASNSYWRIQTSGSSPTCTPHEGTNMVQFNSFSSPNTAGTWTSMSSPAFDFSTDMQISFWMYRDNGYSTYLTEGVYVYVSSTQDTVGATLLGFTTRYRSTNGWDSISYVIPTGTLGTKYIILKATSGYGNNIYVDDLTVDILGGTIPCDAPTALAANNVSQTSANITWTPTGAETSWQIRLGTTGTPIDVTATSYQLTTGLAPGTSYTVYVRANCGGTYSSWISQTFMTTTGQQAPIVTTSQPSNLLQTTATLNGSYIQGTDPILLKGFEYKETSSSTWIADTSTSASAPFTYPLTGLTANTQYNVRAYVETATEGRTYGLIITFTTQANVLPNVTTLMPNPIEQTTATFNGTTAQGTESIMARGFEYKLTSTTTWANPIDVTATGTTTITAPVTTLTVNTQYDVRAYAQTQSDGRTYGNVLTFTTLDNVIQGHVTTQAATSIDTTHAVLNGTLVDVGNAISNIEVGFVYSTITDPQLGATTSITVPVTYTAGMTTFSAPISGLQSSTSYFFKAYVNNSAGPGYGVQETFVTDSSRVSSLITVDPNQFTVTMYPNPATSTTKLVVSGVEGETKIVLSDVQGRILNTTIAKAVNGKVEQTINVNDLAKGVYYVRIQNTTTSRTQKLIVQ